MAKEDEQNRRFVDQIRAATGPSPYETRAGSLRDSIDQVTVGRPCRHSIHLSRGKAKSANPCHTIIPPSFDVTLPIRVRYLVGLLLTGGVSEEGPGMEPLAVRGNLTPVALRLERVDLASGRRVSQIVCFSREEVAQIRRIQQRKFFFFFFFFFFINTDPQVCPQRCLSPVLRASAIVARCKREFAPVHCIS